MGPKNTHQTISICPHAHNRVSIGRGWLSGCGFGSVVMGAGGGGRWVVVDGGGGGSVVSSGGGGSVWW